MNGGAKEKKEIEDTIVVEGEQRGVEWGRGKGWADDWQRKWGWSCTTQNLDQGKSKQIRCHFELQQEAWGRWKSNS